MEIRNANIIIGSAGGNAGEAVNYKISIPNQWANELGISRENKRVVISFDGERIIIEKPKLLNEFLKEKRSKNHDVKILDFSENGKIYTRICADFTDESLCIENYTDDNLKKAFGVNENPSWNDFFEFLGSRCIPKTSSGIAEYLQVLGLYQYDALEIIKITNGKMSEDNMILKIKEL